MQTTVVAPEGAGAGSAGGAGAGAGSAVAGVTTVPVSGTGRPFAPGSPLGVGCTTST